MSAQKTSEVQYGPYRIQRSNPIAVPLELRHEWFLTSNITTWSLWLCYTILQLSFARLVQNESPSFVWRVWIALAAELCLSFQELVLGVNLIFALFYARKGSTRPRYSIIGNAAPSIDVFVTCCGEPNEIILDTVAAAMAQDYPTQQFRVFLLDDGHNAELQTAILLLRKQLSKTEGPKVYYLSREVKSEIKSFFKAGNLQFGIEESKHLGGSEFIASLDADMIPERDWLRRIVPHLILGGDIALACPPQCYYNVPSGDPLGQKAEFDLWFSVYEPLNDRLDAAMCTGSGYIARRSALEEIGGWPQVEAGEDFMCSAVLSNAGWKVAFIREDLQFGLAPDSLRSYIKQRTRWVDSGIEVHKQFGFYLPGSKLTSQLTWVQRGVGILQALREYAPITNVLALILLPLATFPCQKDEFSTLTSKGSYAWLWGIFLGFFVMRKVNNYVLYSHVGLREVWNFQSLDIWCSPYTSFRCIASMLPASTAPLTFESSGSITSAVNERNRLHRKSVFWRLLRVDMIMYLMYIMYASAPLVLRLREFQSRTEFSSGSPLALPPGPTLRLLDCIAKASVPLWYMTFPPTVQERGELMEIDIYGVRRPIKFENNENRSQYEWYSVIELASLGFIWLFS